jgi:hypothetical protein
MENEKKPGRGRPRLPDEVKKERKEMRERGELSPGWSGGLTERVDAGDNAKYLAHAMAIRELPPIDRADPKQVKDRIDWYFQHCINNDMKPTVKGFCNALRVSRASLWEWRTGKFREGTHEEIICQAYDLLEEMWENYMQNGKINPVAGIFLGKNNFGYQDKQEYVLTPNQQQTEIDPATIEAKYAELPDEED